MKNSVHAAAREEQRAYAEHVNPRWAALLEVLQMNVSYDRCVGSELYTAGGRRILDFNSGYCVHNAGHNHPAIKAAIKQEIDRDGPAMLQSHVSNLAGTLAQRLCERAGGRLNKAFFASSGSEGIETVIKFARAHTGRAGLIAARGGFHGLTCGALSLMSDGFWRDGFGPLLPGIDMVEFGELEELGARLNTRKYAALILEPIQVEGGMRIPPPDYLRQAQAMCRRYGTLFVLDEVQTGMYRTGPFLAAHNFDLEPDMVVMAKALSGGLIPVGVVLMSDEINGSVYSSLKRAIVHTSTYSENALAMRAGLATLDVLETEGLVQRAQEIADRLRRQLAVRLAHYEMVRDVRGVGMLTGVEFQQPSKLRLRLLFEAFTRIHPAMFGQVLVMRLFRDKNILTQICGNNFMVLKVAPALTVNEQQAEEFVDALAEVVDLIHSSASFWSEPLGMVRRIINTV